MRGHGTGGSRGQEEKETGYIALGRGGHNEAAYSMLACGCVMIKSKLFLIYTIKGASRASQTILDIFRLKFITVRVVIGARWSDPYEA